MKSLLFLALGVIPIAAFAAPKPTSSAKNQAKATTFLDGIATSYRKLNSASATWHKSGGYDNAQNKWRNDFKSEGTLAWRNFKPVQVRYEDKTGKVIFVTNGQRHLIRVNMSDTIEATYDNPLVELNSMGPDEVSKFFISGRNPLRDMDWGQIPDGGARLLGAATVKGVRCRGVEFKLYELSRDNETNHTFTLWFDSRNLMRRYQHVTLTSSNMGSGDFKATETVEYEVRPNVKLSPSLFTVPALPK